MNFVIKTPSRRVFEVINAILLLAFGIICLLPVWHVICSSFSDPTLLSKHTGVVLWPLGNADHPTTYYGYKMVFGNNSLLMGYANTIFYCAVGATISTVLCTMGGFVLSRKGMLLKKYIMIMLTITMFFNGGLIPTYLVIKMLGMLDTRWVMVIPGAVGVMTLVIIRTAIQGLPDSLEESARLDGAGNLTILFRIVIPLVKATVAVIALQYVLFKWNSYYDALIYLRSRELYPRDPDRAGPDLHRLRCRAGHVSGSDRVLHHRGCNSADLLLLSVHPEVFHQGHDGWLSEGLKESIKHRRPVGRRCFFTSAGGEPTMRHRCGKKRKDTL